MGGGGEGTAGVLSGWDGVGAGRDRQVPGWMPWVGMPPASGERAGSGPSIKMLG